MIREQSEGIARRLPPLQVKAERVAQTILQGMHGRRRAGRGEAFWQFRHYENFDEARRIDWRCSARGSELYVRETEWEAAQSVWIWCDASASMRYRSRYDIPEKVERASVLAVALAILLIEGGENIAPLGEGMPARGGRAGFNIFVQALLATSANSSMPPRESLPRYAQVVMISDFLEPIETYRELIAGFATRGCGGHCLQVLDPSEESFPYAGRIRFDGAEEETSRLLRRAEWLREAYRDRLVEHKGELKELTSMAGWTLATHGTASSPEAALLSLFEAMARSRT